MGLFETISWIFVIALAMAIPTIIVGVIIAFILAEILLYIFY